ncbi:hypothetical protein L596_001196 [Steinernema carpocapsae]|uniref:Uncharacterized protein n=1 Tax=Steinernema carpocapsae TaxID=34508 RepID=A0A4U8UPK9_STECR|nr:hypothetical protein L596_001196 [Steinernema carpocapsae]
MEPENNQQPNIDNEPVAGNPRDEGQQNPAPVVIAFDDVDDATEEEFFESWKFFMYDHEKKWHTERAIQRARNQAAAASASSAPLPSFDSTQHINQSIEDPVDERTLQGPSQAVEQHPVPGPSNSTKQV